MNRKIVFVVIFVILAGIIFYIKDVMSSGDTTNIEQEPQKQVVKVYQLKKGVKKKDRVDLKYFELREMNENEALNRGYITTSGKGLDPQAIYKKDIQTESILTPSDIVTPDDEEYIYLSLAKGHIPYYYEVSNNGVIDAIPLRAGDKVSFVTTSSPLENIRENGYGDISSIESKIIINNAEVIKFQSNQLDDAEDVEEVKRGVVVSLLARDVLKLEMAQKISEVTLIPSDIASNYIFVSSRDIVDGINGVRELRAVINEDK